MKNLKVTATVLAMTLLLAACSGVREEVSSDDSEKTSDIYSDADYDTEINESDSVEITLNGESVTIEEAGTYIISGTLEDGSIVIDASDEDEVQLVLNGCSVTSSSSAPIYVKNAGKVFITTFEGTVNYLSNEAIFEADEDTCVDGVIFSKSDITLNGEGTLVISSADNGIVSKDELVITGGTYEIESAGDSIQANDLIAVDGGTFTISSGDDAIHCEADLIIDGGTIEITECVEGLEGNTVTINDGDITLISSDDGINAAGETDTGMQADPSAWIEINGGNIDISTGGDGIDSNGDLTVNGGYITISGPENSGNGSLDFAGSGTINGGTLIAAGMAGMEMNMTSASQGCILVSTGNLSEGSEITVTDSSGSELLSFTPSTSYSCVLISSPDLQVGQTYTISAGTSSQEVTLEDYIYGGSLGMGGSFEGQMPGRRDGFEGQMPPEFNGEQPQGFDGQTPPEPPNGFDGQMPPTETT